MPSLSGPAHLHIKVMITHVEWGRAWGGVLAWGREVGGGDVGHGEEG